MNGPQRAPRSLLAAWALCCVTAAAVFLVYLATSVGAGRGEVVLPLDDVYIHFQYARQLASGEPYVYNPGEAPTSGATSFLYPYLLAGGHALGFHDLTLGLWALGLGALGLLASGWLVLLLARLGGLPLGFALIGALTFMLSGPVSWHFMSGMETALVVTAALLALYMLLSWRYRGLVAAAVLLALTRPEGAIMALILTGVAGLRLWFEHLTYTAPRDRSPWVALWLLLPVLAITVQPTVNLLLTGSASSTGGESKTLLGMVPFFPLVVIERVLGNFGHMLAEFVTGANWGTPGDFTPLLLGPLALLGMVAAFAQPRLRFAGLVLAGWLLVVAAAVSLLDTAFWHFKRYQMPLIALLYPLALWGAWWLGQSISSRINYGTGRIAAALLLLGFAMTAMANATEFLRLYGVNVENVMAQPLPMARWLAANTPPDAVVAVHDVGMMRYVGQHHTVDMVGLTTPGAADAWRHGPGAVAQFLMAHEPRPDYVAAYISARGLNYLADTGIYGELLAGFGADYAPEDNVALGAEFQGIYLADWSHVEPGDGYALQGSLESFLQRPTPRPAVLVDVVDVAFLDSEHAHEYNWHNRQVAPGFATEVYQMDYVSCPSASQRRQAGVQSCTVLDGGRRIDHYEAFTLSLTPGEDALLVTRLHPRWRGTFNIYANGEFVATRWIPEIPGRWLEVPTLIPGALVSEQTRVRIVPDVPGGYYMPYRHFAYQGLADPHPWLDNTPLIAWQDGAITLTHIDRQQRDQQLALWFHWYTDGSARGDYVFFVHVYDDLDAPPVRQLDQRPAANTLPPGNWIPGIFVDPVVVDLADLPAGRYRVAFGFYDAISGERLLSAPPGGDYEVTPDGRILFADEIEIDDDV